MNENEFLIKIILFIKDQRVYASMYKQPRDRARHSFYNTFSRLEVILRQNVDCSLITTGHEAPRSYQSAQGRITQGCGEDGYGSERPADKEGGLRTRGMRTGMAYWDGEEIAGMGMAMEERRYVWGSCIHLLTANDDVCCRGWSRAVAAVASIHHS